MSRLLRVSVTWLGCSRASTILELRSWLSGMSRRRRWQLRMWQISFQNTHKFFCCCCCESPRISQDFFPLLKRLRFLGRCYWRIANIMLAFKWLFWRPRQMRKYLLQGWFDTYSTAPHISPTRVEKCDFKSLIFHSSLSWRNSNITQICCLCSDYF